PSPPDLGFGSGGEFGNLKFEAAFTEGAAGLDRVVIGFAADGELDNGRCCDRLVVADVDVYEFIKLAVDLLVEDRRLDLRGGFGSVEGCGFAGQGEGVVGQRTASHLLIRHRLEGDDVFALLEVPAWELERDVGMGVGGVERVPLVAVVEVEPRMQVE